MSARIITVEVNYDTKLCEAGAKLRLKGRWLEHCGFRPGAKVVIDTTEYGCVIIRPLPQPVPVTLEEQRVAVMDRLTKAMEAA